MSMKKTFWSDAAIGGGVIGLSLFLVSLIAPMVGESLKSISSLLFYLVLILLIYYFAKKRSLKATGNQTFTYGQSMGYIVVMMLFAGLILGVGNYVIQNYIAPEYFQKQMDEAIAQNREIFEASGGFMQQAIDTMQTLSKNIFYMIFSGLLSTLFVGTIVGLIVSAFVKKKESVFSE